MKRPYACVMLKIVGVEPGPRAIITEEQFSSFEPSLEFKMSATSKPGNAEF